MRRRPISCSEHTNIRESLEDQDLHDGVCQNLKDSILYKKLFRLCRPVWGRERGNCPQSIVQNLTIGVLQKHRQLIRNTRNVILHSKFPQLPKERLPTEEILIASDPYLQKFDNAQIAMRVNRRTLRSFSSTRRTLSKAPLSTRAFKNDFSAAIFPIAHSA